MNIISIIHSKILTQYSTTFFENATIDFIKDAILYFQRNAEKGVKYPGFDVIKEDGTVIQAPHKPDFATYMSKLKDKFGFKWFLMVD